METFWKAIAVIILTVILGVTLGKTEKDISVVLSVAACSIIMIIAMQYLEEVIAFLWQLSSKESKQIPSIKIILKITGVALVTELTTLVSSDAGNSSLGKAVEILGNAAILNLALPLLETFLTILQELMGLI